MPRNNFLQLENKTGYILFFLNKIDLFLIFFISFLPVFWFKGNNFIDTADYGFWLSAAKLFNISLSSFMQVGSGVLSPGAPAFLMPFSIGGMAFKFIGLSMMDYEKFLFVFWFLSSGLSMYYLCSVNKVDGYGRFFASLFYMMNPLSLTIYFSTQSGGLISAAYSLAPLIMAFFIKGINSYKKIIEPIFYASAWFLIGDYAYSNPILLMIQLILFLAYFLFYIYFNFKDRQKLYSGIKFTSVFLIFFFILNLFWFIPYFFSLSLMAKFSYLRIQNFGSAYQNYILNSLSAINIVRLTGFWGMFAGFGKSLLYYKWSPVYKSGLFIFLSFIPIFFIILGVIFIIRIKNRDNIIFFLFIFLFTGLLVNANGSLLGRHLVYAAGKLPFFMEAFSINIVKFGIILSLSSSILFGFGLNKFFSVFKHGSFWFKNIFLLVLFILLFPVYMFPFFNGDIINNGTQHFREGIFRIPHYYYKAKKILLQSGRGNILVMPYNLNGSTYLLWPKKTGGTGGYGGEDMIDESIWPYPVYYSYTGFASVNLEELSIYKDFEKAQNFSLMSKRTLLIYLGYLGVRYIVFHDDYNWHLKNYVSNYYIFDRNSIKRRLGKIKGIASNKRIGGLHIYIIKKKYIKPIIYDSGYLNLINNNYSNSDVFSYIACYNYLPFLNNLVPMDQSIFINKLFINKNNYLKITHSGLNINIFNLNSSHDCTAYSYNNKNNLISNAGKRPAHIYSNIINFKKFSNTQYFVKLKNKNTKSFIMVFNKSYLPYWNAFIVSKRINLSMQFFPLPLREFIYYVFPSFLGKNISNHFVVNGYANGYLVSPKNLKDKSYYVLIEYSLQKYLILGLILDSFIFLSIIIYIIFSLLRRGQYNG